MSDVSGQHSFLRPSENTTVQFGIVRQSHVTRASDVPKYRLRHMSQSPLTKGQNVTHLLIRQLY